MHPTLLTYRGGCGQGRRGRCLGRTLARIASFVGAGFHHLCGEMGRGVERSDGTRGWDRRGGAGHCVCVCVCGVYDGACGLSVPLTESALGGRRGGLAEARKERTRRQSTVRHDVHHRRLPRPRLPMAWRRPTAWVEGMYEVGVASEWAGLDEQDPPCLALGQPEAGRGWSKGHSLCLMGKGEDGGVLVTSLGCQSLCVCV